MVHSTWMPQKLRKGMTVQLETEAIATLKRKLKDRPTPRTCMHPSPSTKLLHVAEPAKCNKQAAPDESSLSVRPHLIISHPSNSLPIFNPIHSPQSLPTKTWANAVNLPLLPRNPPAQNRKQNQINSPAPPTSQNRNRNQRKNTPNPRKPPP